jgi:hypothetical protein
MQGGSLYVQGGSLYVQGGSLYVQGGSLYVQGGPRPKQAGPLLPVHDFRPVCSPLSDKGLLLEQSIQREYYSHYKNCYEGQSMGKL